MRFTGVTRRFLIVLAATLAVGAAAQETSLIQEKPNIAAVDAALSAVVGVTVEVPVEQTTRLTDPNVVMVAPVSTKHGVGFLIATSEKDRRAEFALVAADLVAGARRISVRLADQRLTTAEVYAADVLTNVALLHIGAKDARGAVWADSEGLPPVSWGASLLPGRFVSGAIDGNMKVGAAATVQRSFRYVPILRFAGQTPTLDFGSPIVNAQGRVVGVLCSVKPAPPLAVSSLPARVRLDGTLRTPGVMNIAYALPSSYVQRLVSDLAQYRMVRHPWIGLTFADAPNKGALIVSVTPGSPAADAGLSASDIVSTANGQPIRNGIDLARVITQLMIDSKLELVVARGEAKLTLPAIVVKTQVPTKQAH